MQHLQHGWKKILLWSSLPVSDPITEFKIVDNVFVKMYVFAEAGESTQGHAHTFDHITLLSTGKVTMKHGKTVEEFTAPHLIVTKKGVEHEFIAEETNTVLCCIHAIRDGKGLDNIAPQNITTLHGLDLVQKFPLIEE